VPVTTILAEAGIKPDASEVTFHALGSEYKVVLPLNVVQQDGVFLAHTVNGQVLPAKHGYPLRLVVRGNYGYDWTKWVKRIEIS
jgi:DMSO/TMAO reductase YedYZ molybdopterin-dependent catalytic subunit